MKLVPRLVEKPWGGSRIRERFRRRATELDLVGESHELYDRPGGDSSEIANGPLAGRRIDELRGDRPLPLFTKVIDAREALSVQVHPDEEAAEELGGEPKTEAWYVIESDPDARIYKGFREGVTVPDLLAALSKGRVADLLHSFHPQPGDVVFLPAGTVHAIGAGVLLYEIQQNSDTTYRLFDWNRRGLDGRARALHVHEAIRSASFDGPGLDRVAPRPVSAETSCRRTIRVACPEFVMEEHEIRGPATFETARGETDRWHVAFVLEGAGTLRPFDRRVESVPFTAGDSLLLPAEHDRYEVEPSPGTPIRLLSAFA